MKYKLRIYGFLLLMSAVSMNSQADSDFSFNPFDIFTVLADWVVDTVNDANAVLEELAEKIENGEYDDVIQELGLQALFKAVHYGVSEAFVESPEGFTLKNIENVVRDGDFWRYRKYKSNTVNIIDGGNSTVTVANENSLDNLDFSLGYSVDEEVAVVSWNRIFHVQHCRWLDGPPTSPDPTAVYDEGFLNLSGEGWKIGLPTELGFLEDLVTYHYAQQQATTNSNTYLSEADYVMVRISTTPEGVINTKLLYEKEHNAVIVKEKPETFSIVVFDDLKDVEEGSTIKYALSATNYAACNSDYPDWKIRHLNAYFDEDGDGDPDFVPWSVLHNDKLAAVISTSMMML